MDWLGEGAGAPLIATRAIHFAATTIVAGTLVFRIAVARPVFRSEEAVAKAYRNGCATRLKRSPATPELLVFANDVLQLRLQAAATTVGRFAINSTLGVAGLFDVATRRNLPVCCHSSRIARGGVSLDRLPVARTSVL